MTPADLAPIRENAHRQQRAGLTACILQADQVAQLADDHASVLVQLDELIAAHVCLEDRLAQIEDLIPAALLAWACNYRKDTRAAFVEIEQLAKAQP